MNLPPLEKCHPGRPLSGAAEPGVRDVPPVPSTSSSTLGCAS